MLPFDERLARHLTTLTALALLGAACSDEPTSPSGASTEELEQMCEGAEGPADHLLYIGYVTVDPGTDCPAPEDAQVQVNGCVFIEWQGVTCGLDRVDTNQVHVDNGYGGFFADEGATPTDAMEVGPVVDVCYYEAVFYDDPTRSTVCGRPLLQEGAPVLAGVRAGTDWAAPPAPDVALTAADRAAVTAWWLDAARMEHASIASFAACTLDLMRFGAPPDLLRATHQAGVDEITHARLAFALAGRFGGEAVGPAPMPDLAPVPAATRADFAEAVFREGCVGETLAAVDAAARLAVARDPAARAALEVIVRDESDHAALAWRTVRWLLEGDDGTVRARLAAVADEERSRWTAALPAERAVSPEALACGLLPPAARAVALTRAWHDVIEPSLQSLLSRGVA